MDLRLIGSQTCPFVERIKITLNHLQLGCEYEYIDLANKPDWFLQLSPLGKVPILVVDGEVLFESSVIMSFLNETQGNRLLSAVPLERAKQRAWMEFASAIMADMYGVYYASEKAVCFAKRAQLATKLVILNKQLSNGPFFQGSELQLVDIAYAPFFVRLAALHNQCGLDALEGQYKIRNWSDSLLSLDIVQDALAENFEQQFLQKLRQRNSYIANRA